MTIEEGNKLIHIWLGKSYETDSRIMILKYDQSWDWLMPVVEKISLIPFPKDKGWKEEDYKDFSAYPYPRTFGMRNTEGKFMVRLNASPLFESATLMRATWEAVIDFIQWHNEKT